MVRRGQEAAGAGVDKEKASSVVGEVDVNDDEVVEEEANSKDRKK